MIKGIAIDDEPCALDVIEIHARKIPELELVARFTNSKEALEYLKINSVDLIFLDINMPELSGTEFIKKLKVSPLIIFTTAYTEYALESYDYNTVDYLMKPIEFNRFYKGVNKVIKLLNGKENKPNNLDYFFVKDGYKQVKIVFNHIGHVKSNGNYLDIHFGNNKKTMARMTFSQLLKILPEGLLLRVHNSYMINPLQIQKIENNHIFLENINIPIGIRYKNFVFQSLNIH